MRQCTRIIANNLLDACLGVASRSRNELAPSKRANAARCWPRMRSLCCCKLFPSKVSVFDTLARSHSRRHSWRRSRRHSQRRSRRYSSDFGYACKVPLPLCVSEHDDGGGGGAAQKCDWSACPAPKAEHSLALPLSLSAFPPLSLSHTHTGVN